MVVSKAYLRVKLPRTVPGLLVLPGVGVVR
jgi:hypothetical protein